MPQKLLLILVLVFGLFQGQLVYAHLNTFEGGWVISTINRPNMTLWHSNYSLNSRLSIGVDYLRDGQGKTTEITLLRSNVCFIKTLGRKRLARKRVSTGRTWRRCGVKRFMIQSSQIS